MKNINFLAAALASLTVFSCGQQKGGGGDAAQDYPVETVSVGTTELVTNYPVTIRGREDIEIRPRIDGFIENIYIDEGSVVKQGQTLFKINSPQAEQAVTTAQAAVTSAEAQIATAKLNVSRMSPLAEKGIISAVQLEAYQNAYDAAVAAGEQAKAQLKNAQATLSWTNVTSPVNGHVGAITYRKGSLVNNQNVLTTVANTSTVFAYFSLNEKQLAEFLQGLDGAAQADKLKNAPAVTLTLADGTVYPHKGRIETITGVVDITTGTANFRAEFTNDEGMLRSGTSGKVSIPETYVDVILIPQRATFAQQNKTLVYVVEDGVARQRIIEVTPTPDGQQYIVHSGLKTGERIVASGVATLTDGTKIKTDN
ncbi:MAG: efflux RND transporter periplasmic adaptor subunit [Tannerella sp.]|jgi:membrane fusion protein (multidrug efflux system)|nr:efflux RND transporter periplasmic adaptor subunit [Tannerella sp.]